MPTNSSTDPIPFLTGQIVIQSSEDIESLASRVGEALGNVPFGGKDAAICDEVPAMFADVAGLRFVLQGFPHEHYVLECYPAPSLPVFGDNTVEVDVSSHLLRSLGELNETTISLN